MWDRYGSLEELERRINQYEPDFLIGLHLQSLPQGADLEGIARGLVSRLADLPKESGSHYRIDLQELGLDGFANVYYVGAGMGCVFSYPSPIAIGVPGFS